ncbi:mannosyltransferase [Drechmeria coniospora]|uniref:Mannosyltransferase n=1 Tax=Drechmeria coniospora TaxID=98403 RepID=A0A151GWM5_DRECN|nr:mannosyltransferase [Drechmeria coniospora]KYK61432.1 mannosyltransferase [Drechmeria coniospora]
MALFSARQRSKPPNYLRDIITIRLINAWWLATFFQPDEYFQSLEPAWRLAFGPQSGAWMTWEWHHQLRSSLHPALFSAAYLLADKLSTVMPPSNPIRAAVVMAAPRTLQAVIAGLGDWFTWQLAAKIYGSDSIVSYFALFLQIFSPWQWYVSTRTFSNSLEMTLTAMALYYWPWNLLAAAARAKENPKGPDPLGSLWRLRLSLCLAALAAVLRPTNVLIWATVVVVAFTRVTLKGPSPLTWPVALKLCREAVVCGSVVLALSAASDRLYFGFWTFPAYNFLHFNISKSLAVFYGRNPWHYYLVQGIPLLCTTSLPFAVGGLCKPSARDPNQFNTAKTLSYTVFTMVAALSLISHKEVRFIYPLLPILNVLAAPFAASFFSSPPPPTASSKSAAPQARLRNKPYLLAALGINLLLASYLTFSHQRAPLGVLSYLRQEYERIHPASAQLAHATRRAPETEDEFFALFLMPCHSTPWRSHLVYPGLGAYALTCEPPLHTQPNTAEREEYRDEADRFYDDPIRFLTTELFAPQRKMRIPRYIIGFEGVEPWLHEFLDTPAGVALGINMTTVWSASNGLFSEDWRRAGRVLVWDTGVYENAPPPLLKRKVAVPS